MVSSGLLLKSDRVHLVAAEANERARADSWKTQAATLKEELATVKAERDTNSKLLEDAEASALSLEEQVAKAETEAARARDDLKKFKSTLDKDMDELQRLRQESTIVVPSGRLKLHHRLGRHEALWEPKERMEAHLSPPDSDATKHAWSTLNETIKTQQRDFRDTWEGADQLAEKGDEVDMHPLIYLSGNRVAEARAR